MSDTSWRPPTNGAPNPPQDPEMRLTIDRIAAACAKNGPHFENMMREKEAGKPKFAFLAFGGPFHDYYMHTRNNNIKQLQDAAAANQSFGGNGPGPGTSSHFPNAGPPGSGFGALPPNYQTNLLPPGVYPPGQQPPRQSLPSLMDTPEVLEIQREIEELRQKITDSENNLSAHRAGLEDILQAHLTTTIRTGETTKIEGLLKNLNLDPAELEELLTTMGNPKCSKETIANAKKWIFQNCQTDQLREVILTYLLNKVKDSESSDYLNLHILYLMNDWAYHCKRKREDNQMKMLSRYVPKMYAYCLEGAKSNNMKVTLEEKLLGEWEGKQYFTQMVFKQLQNPALIVKMDRDMEQSTYNTAKESLRANIMATFEGYEQQHGSFALHILSQIEEKQRKIEELRYGPPKTQQPPPLMGMNSEMRRSRFDEQPTQRVQPNQERNRPPPRNGDDIDGEPIDENALKLKKSYMQLPAGIMVPQVPMTEFTFTPIDPEKLEMPSKVLPSQRLLAAKESFFKGLHLDAVVQSEGISDDWDITNYPRDHLEKKWALRDKYIERLKEIGDTIEDVIDNYPKREEEKIMDEEAAENRQESINKINQKVEDYYSQFENESTSGRRSRSRERSRSRGRSRSRSGSRSRSSSRGRRSRRSRRRSSSSSSSGSSSSSSSSSSRSSSRSYRRSSRRHSRSNSRSPRRERKRFNRSPSPELSQASFGFRTPNIPNASSSNTPLSSDNKGAQLMGKMGWTSGKGLGADESGIVDPVDGGEVRDRADQFKGFGSSLDAFEQFRRQRSGTYHERGAQFRGRNAN